MRLLLRELGAYKKSLFFLSLTVLVTTMCSMFMPMLLKHLIDHAIPAQSFSQVLTITGLMLLCTLVLLIAGIGTARFSAEIAMGISHNLREKVFNKVTEFSQQEIDKFSISSLITRSNTDVQNIQFFMAMVLMTAVSAPFMCIIGIILAVVSSPELSLVLIIAVPVLVVCMIILGRMALPLSNVIQDKLDGINLIIREKLTGTRVIRAFGTAQYEQKRFNKVNTDYMKSNKKLMRIVGAFQPVIAIVLALSVAGVFYLAATLANNGVSITTGDVLEVLNYIMYIIASVILLSVVFLLAPRTLASANRISEVLASESLIVEPADPVEKADKRGYLEFRDVSFTYAGADKPAVNHLSFSAGPGQTTAIIGGTGMGKSTIINMIPRLYDATEGQVLVDGIDVRDWGIDDLRARIGFVPQKANLFKGTIDSNIAFGTDNPTETAIEEAVVMAQSSDFVMRKKEKFHSPVSQGGSNFSGGQKQRLCIARAIVRQPEIYVFDDSFSALDFKTDKQLRQALKERTQDATTVIVAQRVSTIMDADQIIVIDRGNIMGIGTHDELLENCEVYREIVQSQMKEEVA